MNRKQQFEASYAAYTFKKTDTYWTDEDRVMKQLTHVTFSKKKAIDAGGMPIISNGKEAYIDTSDLHSVIYGLSGVKKSICFFMPVIYTLAKAAENMIINDPKGELYERMSGFLKHQEYNILCLDFRTMQSDGYNLLEYPAILYKSGQKEKGVLLMNNLVNALAKNQRAKDNDPFWSEAAAQWLSGTGALMLESYPIDKINILNWADYNIINNVPLVAKIMEDVKNNTTKQNIMLTASAADATLRSIIVMASSFLAPFNQNDLFAAMLSHSTFHLEDLVKEKTALFIITDDTTSTADTIVSIIISQIQSYLVDMAYKSPSKKLGRRCNFIIDEFQSLNIPNMELALATHRSRNIRYYLCVQSLAGLQSRYERPEALLANCGNIFFLGSTEKELLDKISDLCGMTNITKDGSERPLVTPSQLSSLEKTWSYKQAIYLSPLNGIKLCTNFPSIEAYDIGNYAPVKRHFTHSDCPTFSVKEFIKAVHYGKIPTPFSNDTNKHVPPATKVPLPRASFIFADDE